MNKYLYWVIDFVEEQVVGTVLVKIYTYINLKLKHFKQYTLNIIYKTMCTRNLQITLREVGMAAHLSK